MLWTMLFVLAALYNAGGCCAILRVVKRPLASAHTDTCLLTSAAPQRRIWRGPAAAPARCTPRLSAAAGWPGPPAPHGRRAARRPARSGSSRCGRSLGASRACPAGPPRAPWHACRIHSCSATGLYPSCGPAPCCAGGLLGPASEFGRLLQVAAPSSGLGWTGVTHGCRAGGRPAKGWSLEAGCPGCVSCMATCSTLSVRPTLAAGSRSILLQSWLQKLPAGRTRTASEWRAALLAASASCAATSTACRPETLPVSAAPLLAAACASSAAACRHLRSVRGPSISLAQAVLRHLCGRSAAG